MPKNMRITDPIREAAAAVHSLLSAGPMSIEALSTKSGWSAPTLRRAIRAMQLSKAPLYFERVDGRWVLRTDRPWSMPASLMTREALEAEVLRSREGSR
jgi:predicted DNA-binding transcriptional regulator YafY